MSAPGNVDTRARLLTFLFWGGIALAPLAALLLIFAGSSTTGLRFAAIIAIIAVVAAGLSITMRRDTSTKLDLEETLLDEIDMLRDDVRVDITTAARATHRALADKVQSLQETIEHLRRQAEAARAAAQRPQIQAIHPGMPRRPGIAAGPGGVVHTETVQVTTRHTIVDPGDAEDGYSPGVYRTRPAPPRSAAEDRGYRVHTPPDEDPRSWGERWHDGGRRHDDRPPRDEGPAPRAVTASRDESWTEQRLREYATRRPSDPYPDSGEIPEARRSYHDDPGDDDGWSGMRVGDRWAEVRSDEHGRELRMGERRAAVRTDETGTQLRIVDRWSSVRQDIPGTGRYTDDYENTGETRRQRRQREEAAELVAADRRLRRQSTFVPVDDSGHWPEVSRPALPSSVSDSPARYDDRDRARDDRSRDDRDRDDRARGDRYRDDRSRDDRYRDDRDRDDRDRDDRDRDDRARDRDDDDRLRDDRAGAQSHLDQLRSIDRVPRSHESRRDGYRDDPREDERRADRSYRDEQRLDGIRRDDRRDGDSRRSGSRPDDGYGAERRPDDLRRSGPRRSEPRRDEYRDAYRDEPRRGDARRDIPRRVDARRDETRRDDPRRGDARRDDPRRDDARRDVPRQDGYRGDESPVGQSRAARSAEARRPATPASQARPEVPRQRAGQASRRDDRDDDRWEREPSGQRAIARRRLDFEVTDDRWR